MVTMARPPGRAAVVFPLLLVLMFGQGWRACLAAEWQLLSPDSVAVDEGSPVGSPVTGRCDVECCKLHCDATADCNSFTHASGVCYLKNRCVSPGDAAVRSGYRTYFREGRCPRSVTRVLEDAAAANTALQAATAKKKEAAAADKASQRAAAPAAQATSQPSSPSSEGGAAAAAAAATAAAGSAPRAASSPGAAAVAATADGRAAAAAAAAAPPPLRAGVPGKYTYPPTAPWPAEAGTALPKLYREPTWTSRGPSASLPVAVHGAHCKFLRDSQIKWIVVLGDSVARAFGVALMEHLAGDDVHFCDAANGPPEVKGDKKYLNDKK